MADSRESRPPRKRQPSAGSRKSAGPRASKPRDGKPRDGKPRDGKPRRSEGGVRDGKPRGGKPQDGKPGKPRRSEGGARDGKPEGKRWDGKPRRSEGGVRDGKPRGGKPQDGKPGKPRRPEGGARDGKPESKRWEGKPRGGRPQDGRSRRSPDASGDGRSGGRDGRRPARERDDRPPRDTSNDLPWPEDIFELELEADLLAELEAAGGPTATMAKHLLSVQVLAEDDPEAAYQHACRVRDRLPRAALARQTACIAAYRAGHFREAIKEESAYRRISGSGDLVPMAADSERGLGRPERALALVAEFGGSVDPETRTELLIVGAGARQDLGDLDAARVLAQKAVRAGGSPMAMARSRYALGRLLADAGDVAQARKWLQSAVDIDEESIWTDAVDVLENL